MSWIEELSQIYNENNSHIGYEAETGAILLPPYHSTAKAQIEITIDQNGNFLQASTVSKEDVVTIIPVTMDSGARSSDPSPHPLCDKLIYIAGDYARFVPIKEKDEDKYQDYITLLGKWQESPYTHPKVDAIYNYLKEGTLIQDLINERILEQEENGTKLSNAKIEGIDQKDCFVRFRVEGPDRESRTWRDESLFDSFILYNESVHQEKQLCYATGTWIPCTEKHPNKIRNSGDKAKIISANDKEGFSYLGRFLDKDQFCAVGYEVSEKAHDALKWLIQRQGWYKGSYSIVSWERHMAELPPLITDSIHMLSPFDDEEIRELPKTGQAYAKELNKAMNGYRAKLDAAAKITVMGLDSAVSGKGRLSIVLYRELSGSRFLDHIEKWHADMAWYFVEWIKKKPVTAVFAPSPTRIATSLYGTEQNEKIVAKDDVVRQTVDRLIPCIIDAKPIPKDLIRQAVSRASFPQAYEKKYNWEEVLNVACALIRKGAIEKNEGMITKKEDYLMSLDKTSPESSDRSYLYGRLLAVADIAEQWTFERGEERQTNAKRYMSAFAAKPFSTWKIIEERLQSYIAKLDRGGRVKISKTLNEIYDHFRGIEEFGNDTKLDGKYLLGYHCQVSDFYKGKNKDEQIKEEEK